MDLSEAVAANADPVTISWSFADGASFGTDAECFDSTDGSLITDIAAETSANCRSVVSAGSETAQILITANADSVADAADLIKLNLAILDGEGYNIGDAQSTHEVDIVAIVVQPDADFAEARSDVRAEGGGL